MNIHYFQHVPFEGLGNLTPWVYKPGNKVTATRFYEDQRLPFVELFDVLIILGGPMGAYDEALHPWLKAEKELIAKAIERKKKIIGICLGAQLLAEVLGAKVYPNKEKEIGWFPIQFTPEAKTTSIFEHAPDTLTVLHWHGDTFDLPQGATRMASSEACLNQAFVIDNQIVGLQFHLETNLESLTALLEGGKEDLLNQGNYIQSEDSIAMQVDSYAERNTAFLYTLLNELTKDKA